MPGGEAAERILHAKFAHLRVRGEWFRYTDKLRRFIEQGAEALESLKEEIVADAGDEVSSSVHELRNFNIYFIDDVIRIFRLPRSGIAREIRLGRLRVSRRGGRYIFFGVWLREWLEKGEVALRRANGRNGVSETLPH
jgi:hypothetical protein